tara:strand:- start:2467 stop:3456 length:990 start_codon:yes stop_codon:yes gene_type:complete
MNNRAQYPWNKASRAQFLFPLDKYEKTLDYLNINKIEFIEYWITKHPDYIEYLISLSLVQLDWLWSIYLPLIFHIKNHLISEDKPLIIGISGLPGSGKSTFAENLEKISLKMQIPLQVISLDDFYLPSPQLDYAMKGNPWNVPRGLPGSHSIPEINESIKNFINTGILSAPRFNKALRNGMGDRSGWLKKSSKVLIFEGWFLGCTPLEDQTILKKDSEEYLDPPLTEKEINYRALVQDSLSDYLSIWSKIDTIWHLKAELFSNTSAWKVEQEKKLKISQGNSLEGNKLASFVRMIKASIPQRSLQNIESDIILTLNKNRHIINIDCNKH